MLGMPRSSDRQPQTFSHAVVLTLATGALWLMLGAVEIPELQRKIGWFVLNMGIIASLFRWWVFGVQMKLRRDGVSSTRNSG